MRRWVNRIGLAVILIFVAIQFVPVNRNNPTVNQRRTIYASIPVPKDVKAVFEQSCKNCHSNETTWPWYSYVAPVSWIVAHDVHTARELMNLSEWAGYSTKKKTEKLEEICEQLTNGDMPDKKYTFLHRRARTTAKERDVVCQWTDDSREY